MDIKRLFDFLYYQFENYPQERVLAYQHNGEWQYLSTARLVELAEKTARGLITTLQLQPGDKVVLVASQNRPEWLILDLALQMVGAVSVAHRPHRVVAREGPGPWIPASPSDVNPRMCAALVARLRQAVDVVRCHRPRGVPISRWQPCLLDCKRMNVTL